MVEGNTMQYRHLGNAGIKVSVLSYGNWLTGHDIAAEQTNFDCIKKSIESGVNFIDTAEVYGAGTAESIVGAALKKGDWDREELVISTKFMKCGNGPNRAGLSRKRMIEGMRNSLKRLQLDYVDVMFLHRPDSSTPLEETIRAVNHLID
jgi:aryl-alcohol dehydrogenase-like predicted oxidoreductase